MAGAVESRRPKCLTNRWGQEAVGLSFLSPLARTGTDAGRSYAAFGERKLLNLLVRHFRHAVVPRLHQDPRRKFHVLQRTQALFEAVACEMER